MSIIRIVKEDFRVYARKSVFTQESVVKDPGWVGPT